MCKRLFAVLLAVTLICSAAIAVHAEDSSITLYGFSFTVNDDGNAVIHSYDNRSTDVVIPKTLLGAEVIDDYAFFGNTEINSISFENCDGLKSIGTNAFYGCTGIKDIIIPASVTEIGFGAFQNCASLETVSFGNAITTIPKQLFYNCESLKSVVVPDSVESLGDRCFSGCTSLAEMEIPNSVTSIALALAFVKGLISFPTFLAGMITTTGLGLYALSKYNEEKNADNSFITIVLLAAAIVTGLLVFYNIGFLGSFVN